MYYGDGFENDGRRNPLPATRKVHEPKALNALHLRILQLKACGAKHVDIAAICGCTPQTVTNVANSDLGKRKLRMLTSQADLEAIDVRTELEAEAKKSTRVLSQAIDGELELAPKDLVSTAFGILDRAGYSAKSVHLHAHQHQHLTPDEISEIKREAARRAQEAGIIAGDDEVIDAECEVKE